MLELICKWILAGSALFIAVLMGVMFIYGVIRAIVDNLD